MSWPELVMLAVVAGIGVPAARWNLTSFALVVSWLLAQGAWLVTGDNTPLRLYVILDGIVLGLIFAKAPMYQGRGLLLGKSWGDRIVIAIFPVAWLFYVVPIDEFYRWYILWALTIVQFTAAAGDVVAYLRSRGRTRSDIPPPGMYRLAWGSRWRMAS